MLISTIVIINLSTASYRHTYSNYLWLHCGKHKALLNAEKDVFDTVSEGEFQAVIALGKEL